MFSLESPWTLDYVLAPLPPLGIGLSVAVTERGGEGSFFSLREAYVLSFSLLLCLEPCKKFSVVGGWVVVDSRLRPEPDYPAETGTGIPVPVSRNRIWIIKIRFRLKEPE